VIAARPAPSYKETMKLVPVLAALGLAAAAAGAAQAKAPLAYRTDEAAETYLERLTSWHGVRLVPALSTAICINGFYSKTEQHTRRHFEQRVAASGEGMFHSFRCILGSNGHTFSLYVVASPRGFTMRLDR